MFKIHLIGPCKKNDVDISIASGNSIKFSLARKRLGLGSLIVVRRLLANVTNPIFKFCREINDIKCFSYFLLRDDRIKTGEKTSDCGMHEVVIVSVIGCGTHKIQ